MDFDIRNFVGKLIPVPKKKGKYVCPACGGNNLSVSQRTGKYNCWNCGDTKAIACHLSGGETDIHRFLDNQEKWKAKKKKLEQQQIKEQYRQLQTENPDFSPEELERGAALLATLEIETMTQQEMTEAIDKLEHQEYQDSIRALLENNYSEADLDFEVQAIASKFRKQDSQVWRAYKRLSENEDKKEQLQSIGKELDELLQSSKSVLDLSEYLPGDLLKIKEIYQRLCLRPEVALMQFLTTISGLLPVGSSINLCNYTNFEQSLALFFAICAEPSQRKSPGQKQIVTQPLRILQKKADTEYKARFEDYEIAMAEWKQRGGEKSGEPEPKEPKRRIYYINGATQAGLRNLLNKEQVHGLNIIYDEMAGDFRNRSKKYNAGLTEDLLSYYDGLGKREALADGFAGDFDEVLLAVQGSIQPGVVAEFLNGEDDPNGYWSRISIVNQPNQVLIVPEDNNKRQEKIDITELLAGHYRKFAALTDPLKLRLSPKAEDLMIKVMNRCDLKRVEAKSQGIAAQWGKLPGKIGRLAALIHLSEQLYHGSAIDPVVPIMTLHKAIKLGYFLLQEATSLYADNSPGNLTAHLKKILELAQAQQKPISAREIQQSSRILKSFKPEMIRDYFDDLQCLGYGEIVGAGIRRKFQIVDACRQNVDETSTAATHTEKEFNKTVDIVDTVDKIHREGLEGQTPPRQRIEKVITTSTMSTMSTKPKDAYRQELSTVDKAVDSLSTKNVNFDRLQGEIVFDSNGNPHRIIERNGQMWKTDRGIYVSREDWRNGVFSIPTIQTVAQLVGRINTTDQLRWVTENLDELMVLAISEGLISDDKVAEIYSLE